jgi:hypothetical protein
VCFVFGLQSKVNCVVLFVLCWFVEQLNCAVLFWFPEQVNCVLCESRERHREEVKVAFSVESAPTLFFSVFWGVGLTKNWISFWSFVKIQEREELLLMLLLLVNPSFHHG